MSIQKAILLAAGIGARMRPLTLTTPKPLLPVGNKPLMGWILEKAFEAGIQDALINVSYLGDQIQSFYKDQPHLHFSVEPTPPFETAGAIVNVLPFFENKPFLSLNGDSLWQDVGTPALKRLFDAWDPATMDALLLLVPKAQALGFEGPGDYFYNDGALVRRLDPIPTAPYINTGVVLFSPDLFKDEPLRPFSNLMMYDKAQAKGRLFGVIHDGPWFHFGTPEAYHEGVPLFLKADAP